MADTIHQIVLIHGQKNNTGRERTCQESRTPGILIQVLEDWDRLRISDLYFMALD